METKLLAGNEAVASTVSFWVFGADDEARATINNS